MSSPTTMLGQPVQVHPQPMPARLIITIDGPAATGKSTAARDLAKKLGLEMLNTGAMYRAATALAIDAGLELDSVKRPDVIAGVCEVVQNADLHFDWSARPTPVLLVCNKPMVQRLADADVNHHVSAVSSIPEIRRHMVRKQQLIAQQHPRLVSEGRDQGSVVFPDADVKFYLTASVESRARRAASRMTGGTKVDLQQLMDDVGRRDALDSSRVDSPLVCPNGAHKLDTSSMSLEQVIRWLEDLVRLVVPLPTQIAGASGAAGAIRGM